MIQMCLAEEFPDRVTDWETESQPAISVAVAVRSGPERLLSGLQFIIL